jgi:hypothetical protein
MRAADARRRHLFLGGAAVLIGAAAARSATGQSGTDYAVFTEFSPDTKLMQPGWNRRVFTDTDVHKGNSVRCDFSTGVVSVAPGAYRITGHSMVVYDSGQQPPETTTIRAPYAAAGYCRLRTFDPKVTLDPTNLHALSNSDPSVICVGSPSSANLVPSLFEGFFETDKPAQLVLEHQSGTKPEQIYLRIFTQNSKWHAFARISIRRL